MMSEQAVLRHAHSGFFKERRLWLLALAGLVALGDILLFQAAPGINVPLFLTAVAAAAFCLSPTRVSTGVAVVAALCFSGAMLSLAEAASWPGLALGVLVTALFVAVVTTPRFTDLTLRLIDALRMLAHGPMQFLQSARKVRDASGDQPRIRLASLVRTWALPVILGAVFLALFAAANPIIDRLTHVRIEPREGDLLRLALWVAIIIGCLPLIRRKPLGSPRRAGLFNAGVSPVASESWAQWLGAPALFRALVLFNALFAMQTVLDLAYLWGGVALPDGMTYAQYAHRGAYPLMVTVLIAAAFVLIAMRRGGPAREDSRIGPLVLLFTLQNIWLVISSMLRLNLYVATYSLTWMRVAAFLWMVLVAIGLVLILIQIVRGKSLRWLISANLAAALAILLAGNAIDPRWIADYNLAHAREMGGAGQPIDYAYLSDLGPGALPAIDALIPEMQARFRDSAVAFLRQVRARHLRQHASAYADWRSFTFQGYRLQRYLDARAAAERPNVEQPL